MICSRDERGSNFALPAEQSAAFAKRWKKYKRKPAAGDVLLCYLTGVMRWVGALEVVERSNDRSTIWDTDAFPYRFKVKPLVLLDPAHGVPLQSLEGKLDFYRSSDDRGGFRGFLRMSPNAFKRTEDGDLILSLMREAKANPVEFRIVRSRCRRSVGSCRLTS